MKIQGVKQKVNFTWWENNALICMACTVDIYLLKDRNYSPVNALLQFRELWPLAGASMWKIRLVLPEETTRETLTGLG
jgi:hypothetical protein